MARIDCETRESTLNTVAYFYNLTASKVDKFLLETNISEIHRGHFQSCPFDKALREIFNQEFGEPVVKIDEVCWFHITRTRSDSTFQAGILPLGAVMRVVGK